MDKTQKSFLGKWESLSLETRPNAWGGINYLKRFFHNTEDEAIGTLVFYTDDTGDQLNMTLSVIGPYHFGEASEAVPGAVEVDFDFTRFVVTPHSQTMVETLNKSRPPGSKLEEWKSNQSQTVDAGIKEGLFGMVIGEYKEYDLVKVEEGLLFYGERPHGPSFGKIKAAGQGSPLLSGT